MVEIDVPAPDLVRPPEVVLVRHGRTPLNAEGRLRGHLDPPLDDIGRVQATAVAAALAYLCPGRVVTSPLLRARQTAEAIAQRANADLIVDERLIDRDYGPWAGQPVAAVTSVWGTLDDAPCVEPATQLTERALRALEDHARFLDEGAVVLVAHDAVNQQLLAHLDPHLGRPEDITQAPGCWNVLFRQGPRWVVAQVNQHAPEVP
jgi:broad specificity phosphatase PhoE